MIIFINKLNYLENNHEVNYQINYLDYHAFIMIKHWYALGCTCVKAPKIALDLEASKKKDFGLVSESSIEPLKPDSLVFVSA